MLVAEIGNRKIVAGSRRICAAVLQAWSCACGACSGGGGGSRKAVAEARRKK